MLIGSINDPLALGWNDRSVPAGSQFFNQILNWGMPVLDSWDFKLPVITSRYQYVTAADNEVAANAYRYDFLKTYRDVKFYSDSEILLMSRVEALKLYYDQFNFTIKEVCAGEDDLLNCPQLILSEYTKQLEVAARRSGQWFPTNQALLLEDREPTQAPNQRHHPCRAFAPEDNSTMTDRFWLYKAGFDLMKRIYALRPDLRTVRDPNTGQDVEGLISPDKLYQSLPPCTRKTEWTDYLSSVVFGAFALIMPGLGWVLLVQDTIKTIRDRQHMAEMIDGINVLIEDLPNGIVAILNERVAENKFTDYATASHIATDDENRALAASIGLAHPAMICDPMGGCTIAEQKARLVEVIDEWNTKRLLDRRVKYEAWVNSKLREATTNLHSHDSTQLDCKWTPWADECRQASAEFKAWAQATITGFQTEHIPPAPSTIGKPYSTVALDNVEQILADTAWLEPDTGGRQVVPEGMQNLVESVYQAPPIEEPKSGIPWGLIGFGLIALL